jgi:hypothetical protein
MRGTGTTIILKQEVQKSRNKQVLLRSNIEQMPSSIIEEVPLLLSSLLGISLAIPESQHTLHCTGIRML